jgi:hypothetical protein
MNELILILLSSIKLLSGYPIPEQLPIVHLVPHAVLEEKACHKPCQILGWFSLETNEIYLDDTLDLKGSVLARSVLLHELVHYVQQVSGKFDGKSDCESWTLREKEAYAIQNRWLYEQGSITLNLMMLNLGACLHGR